MSAYWPITDKDHLLELMVETIHGEDLHVEVTGDWRAGLARLSPRQSKPGAAPQGPATL